ncbi:type 1 fimbrial protein [Klebsiella sp. RHBSTW-00215]|uniref:fimbrial protein n=1 Tax=Klebsiella sp. RHBSTW-00215 TaxID=2742640 RepID=UPI0015F4FAEA|nr:fimbrial protein [Klebsiella sp. RHBSTW-00215]MBA7933154.1 type 1 fimbrial protein [Klebsiella sp. RHBSTW-00215]
MKTKRALLSIALSAFIFSASSMAASDNTITFLGEVTDQTCSVSVNGATASPIVLLPTVSIADLTTNTTAGATTFDIGVSDCAPSSTGVTIASVFVGNNVGPTGNLANTIDGSAGDVEIQVMNLDDSNPQPIDFSNVFNGADDLSLDPNETSATATYTAQYYSSGAPAAGTVKASMQYAISYP